jgi:hypothetical protein
VETPVSSSSWFLGSQFRVEAAAECKRVNAATTAAVPSSPEELGASSSACTLESQTLTWSASNGN